GASARRRLTRACSRQALPGGVQSAATCRCERRNVRLMHARASRLQLMRQSLGSTRRPISGGMVDRRNFLASAALGSISAPFARRQSPLEQDAPWQYDGAGTIARFGVVTPDFDPVPESELWAMASRGISVHGTRVPRPARPADFVGSPNIDNAVDR